MRKSSRLVASNVRALDSLLGEAGRPLLIKIVSPPVDRDAIKQLADVLKTSPRQEPCRNRTSFTWTIATNQG